MAQLLGALTTDTKRQNGKFKERDLLQRSKNIQLTATLYQNRKLLYQIQERFEGTFQRLKLYNNCITYIGHCIYFNAFFIT